MPKAEDDKAMRMALVLANREQPDIDESGEIVDKPYWAHKYKLSGMSWNQVAKKVGYNTELQCYRSVQIYLQEAALSLSKSRQAEALELQLDRLEELISSYWEMARLGDLDSANYVLKLMQEEAKLQRLYEDSSGQASAKYIVITQNREQYVEELKAIALGNKQDEVSSDVKTG